MTVTLSKPAYDLVFQALQKGAATVHAYRDGSDKPMSRLSFAPGDRINIRVLGPDGSASSMESVAIDFKVKRGPPSPLGDGKKTRYVWQAGEQATHTVGVDGRWDFSAELTAKNGTLYKVPDPEFQVGDGHV